MSERYGGAEPHENAKSVIAESIDGRVVRKSVAYPNGLTVASTRIASYATLC